MRAMALLLIILVLGCLQPTETPRETVKPTEVPTMTPKLTTSPATETPIPTPIVTIKPEKEIVINLLFPNGTVEENGKFILGEFTENFTLKVEPEDAHVYLNGTKLGVTNGGIVLSVAKGGDYEIVVKKDEKERVYNVFIGHGDIKAEWIKTERTHLLDSNSTTATIYPDGTCLAIGQFRIFYEDGTNAQNKIILGIREGYGSIWFNITTNEHGIGVFNLSTAYNYFTFDFIDKITNKTLLKGYFSMCWGEL